ncbi:MAG: [protein-PII] uridylyltransferase [Steroidobacteraceae bacterium]
MQTLPTEDFEELTVSARDPAWDYLTRVENELAAQNYQVAAFRAVLNEGDNGLKQRFNEDDSVEVLVRDRARLVDALLRTAWRLHVGNQYKDLALIAVGGYGRGELNLCSDIDVMILLPKTEDSAWQTALEGFLTFMWDIGLEVGHSVRTIDDCQRESAADVSVATTLIESRLLAGPETLLEAMRRALAPERVWPTKDFFEAKVAEQVTRHGRYHDTAYNLEPNVKSSPGGLRDIQTIGWVAKRHFGADSLDELVKHNFLTRSELRKLKAAQAFLWRVRFALHLLTGRREDRILFDYQIKLAKMFGYEDATYTLAVEQFMQRYYRNAMEISLLNEMLLQLFSEAILSDPNVQPVPVNPRFQIRNGYLETMNEDVFERTPSALLEIFVILQQHSELRGVSASTIRQITRHLWLIDDEFRQQPRNHRLFMEILHAPVGVTHELRRMNAYGVLGRYIPAFGRVVGRMQYDLFHVYTVDAHTLFVLSNLRRLAMPKFDHELPALSRIMQALPKPEVAYLGALFHDIAKGRGGDHSELGSVDSETFCLEQGMSRYDARLVSWLVRNHLVFSITAQKKDISDPQIINEFAQLVGDQTHLDYLYVLTVSDVRGTNPKLWNNWKASLFIEFYERVKRVLRRGSENPIDKEELVAENQAAAREILLNAGISAAQVEGVWERFPEIYFVRFNANEIAWHTELLANRASNDDAPLVSIRQVPGRGGTAVLAYTSRRQHSFAKTTALLDQMGINIVDARIMPTTDDHSLDTYHVLEDTNKELSDATRIRHIETELLRILATQDGHLTAVTRRATRQARLFTTQTQINFSDDTLNNRTILELIAGDRPGLLSQIGQVFIQEHVYLHDAKIGTVGERAEDVFYVTDEVGHPLLPQTRERLQQQLIAALDQKTLDVANA